MNAVYSRKTEDHLPTFVATIPQDDSYTDLKKFLVLDMDEYGFVEFGDVARGLCSQQCQYASRYVRLPQVTHEGGMPGYPDLSDGLRVSGQWGNYHSYKIHYADVIEFVTRYWTHRAQVNGSPLYKFMKMGMGN